MPSTDQPAPLRIALFASAFHPHVGGVEELCRQLAHELRRLNHHVIVITNRWPRNLAAFETFEGIPVYRIPMRTPGVSIKASVNYRLTHAAICRALRRILTTNKINLLHIQCVSSNALYALHAKSALNLPLITTLQGELTMDAAGLYQKSPYAQKLLRRVLTESDFITACSAKTLQDGEGFFGSPFGPRGKVVFNGASIHDFDNAIPHSHPNPYILAIGRVVPQKGFDTLLRAYAAAQPPGHDLIIAGDGPELPFLKQLAADLQIAPKVHFAGKADRRTAVSLFAGASFFVLPSRADEGLPVVCAEALAAGKAIIATRSGGTPEAVIHETHGLIVDKEDTPALAAAIFRLTTDTTLRTRLASAAKSRSQLFSWPTIADQYIALYQQVLSTTSKPLALAAK